MTAKSRYRSGSRSAISGRTWKRCRGGLCSTKQSPAAGGWNMRVALARVLLGRPDFLLMDEPTNHLDLESIIWLEQFLKSYPGALLMTTHDREFMNRLVSKIAEIES